MENQHRKIAGYRELSQQEIDLMNRIKAKGGELLALQAELEANLLKDARLKAGLNARAHSMPLAEYESSPEHLEFERFTAAEPQRWAAIGKTDIQTGIMALVRAVAQPAGV